ncbi:MAG: hypothetical protein ACK5IC_02575 [Moheibacter sp.]
MKKTKKHKSQWRHYYWLVVCTIFIALVFMVRFVLNSSKVYVDFETLINPYFIEWDLEHDNSLRINEPYFLKTNYSLIASDKVKLETDSTIYPPLRLNIDSVSTLRNIKRPYLLWKNANSDTIYVLKNNLLLHYRMVEN